MKIAVPSLRRGRHVFETTVPASVYGEWIAGSGLEVCSAITVRAVVHKVQEELLVAADVAAVVRAECARCLEQFEMPLAGAFQALYVPSSQRDMTGPAAHRAEGESQRVLYYSGGEVDLAEQVVETLSLAVPMKPLCSETCKGICPTCGANLNETECNCPGNRDFYRPFKGLFGKTQEIY